MSGFGREKLFDPAPDELTTYELIELINDDNIVVNRCSNSYNSYGGFLFIGLHNDKTGDSYTYYGAGYHEYYETYMIDKWVSYRSVDDETLRIAKGAVLHQIKMSVDNVSKQQLSLQPPSAKATIYSELVDTIGDEDDVLVQMEDMRLT
jgi:hypothetical protein